MRIRVCRIELRKLEKELELLQQKSIYDKLGKCDIEEIRMCSGMVCQTIRKVVETEVSGRSDKADIQVWL